MKKEYWILIIILILLSGSFYWFSWKPTEMRKKCFQESDNVKTLMIKARKSDEEINYIVDSIYEDCLKSHGLKK